MQTGRTGTPALKMPVRKGIIAVPFVVVPSGKMIILFIQEPQPGHFGDLVWHA